MHFGRQRRVRRADDGTDGWCRAALTPAHWHRRRRVRRADNGTADKQCDRGYGGAALTNVPCVAWAPMHWRRRRVRRADDGTADKQCDRRGETHYMAFVDSQLYEPCHQEEVTRCHVIDNWHLPGQNQKVLEDPVPQVLACVYRSGFAEADPLGKECALYVRQVMCERAARVNLLPEIEENCRDALSEYCSQNVKPTEEMHCLQEHFEQKEFKERYGRCYSEVERFTQMESRDTRLNRLLTQACRPVISTYCAQYQTQEIDHGDVMECLAANKEAEEMSTKCRSYVNHFELISLRDYHFSYRFTQACQDDIRAHCVQFGQDKGAIIRCLSNIVFEHRVLGEHKDLSKDCKKQLRVAYLQQEQFDDKQHMDDADLQLMKKCTADLQRYNCMDQQRFEDVVECLRVHFDNLGCKTDGALEANTLSSCLVLSNMDESEMTGECEQRRPAAGRNSTGTRSWRTLGPTKIMIVLVFVAHLFFCVAADNFGNGTTGNIGWLDVLLYVLLGLGGVAVVSIAACAIVALIIAIRRCCRKYKTKDEEAPDAAAAGPSFIEELRRAISFRRETLHAKGMYV
ncbi:hypothetical protein niasHT_038939 [Heterodera trifolii]|uniref:Golgi apparatus protein 1 n=1 Tax=Heterodera trifolii TaxID=157864 RepID=A0ABD2IMZ4_9BILA